MGFYKAKFKIKVSYIILSLLFLVTALFFQNCGKGLQSNLSNSTQTGLVQNAIQVQIVPVCNGGFCGASYLGFQSVNNSGTGNELQFTEFELRAQSLLLSNEHLAVGLMSNDQVFNSNGTFKSTASGGGIGIAFGELSSDYHPCPVDINNDHTEIGIEVFDAYDVLKSTVVSGCQSILKSRIAQSSYLKVNIQVNCINKICSAAATIRNQNGEVLAQVSSSGIQLRNPTIRRDIWYGVTNFSAENTIDSATIAILNQSYVH